MYIRIAIIDDLNSLATLFNDYRMCLGKESNQSDCTAFIQARLFENDSVIFLAFKANVPVGFIQLFPSYSSILLRPLWYFDDLYVADEFRGMGIAAALIAKAKELADETQVVAVRRDKIEGAVFLLI
ncbi:GNAT family N-acetyltransferase [Shewanella sp. D64]|uniref:GNAT family N-acetyltransferase n=1 Tax=unclassified Shewanella TaxID=196818 RepID=UPI0022BA3EB3|nr:MULTISPECIES: GNAT family N-acetyltransferase [unclassified Shewanella]MEC4728313.1 GNAT family N-acetyltransferase [Shewanella sp. D64]MEC4740386.1 GNAT family N-acetyltransferase [Shewanella sp. E94]WBJ93316.1 GNAT family N-acetyltransferase [Shewanella sp. MTB7]